MAVSLGRRNLAPLLAVVLGALALCACRGGGDAKPEVVVFAAVSLTESFGALEADFEKANPNVDLMLNFAGSQSLRTQIENGATAQVFASANQKHMDALANADLVADAETFANNSLVIAVPADNPADIQSFGDLPKAQRLVLAGEVVPAGAYADRVIQGATEFGADFADRVYQSVVSRENHVRHTLQKVLLGEADAAIVYATDAKAVGDKIKIIDIPDDHNIIASYPIAMLKGAAHERAAKSFISFVQSEAGKKRLSEFGFR